MSAAGIAHQLGAIRQGNNWRVLCPRGCGYALSLSDREGGGLLLHCFGGCTFNEIELALVEYGLLDGDDGDVSHVSRPVIGQRDDPARIAHARQIYDSGAWDERIAVYLRARGIGLTSPILKFQEETSHRLGARLPAMLAPVVDVSGEQTGVHLTYLRGDGGSKVDLPKEFQRECRGVIRGGAIRLIPFDPGVELGLAEGVETGLSFAELFDLPCWSAVYAGGLKTLEIPSTVRRIIIAADNDVSGAGQRKALAAYDRWTAEGRSVRIRIPPNAGDDFNDVLIKRGADV